MDVRDAQIYSWIQTGKHTILTDYDKANSDLVELDTGELEQLGADFSSDDGTSATSTVSTKSASPAAEKLIGADDDILIPKPSEIDRVFQEGQETWRRCVVSAQSLPRNSLSAGLNDPSIILKDVPALPKALPKHGVLTGQLLWHVPCGEHDVDSHNHHKDLDLEHLKRAIYTSHAMQLKPTKDSRARRGNVNLHLGNSASYDLVKWLCAILAPKPGLSVEGGGFAPWAAFCSGNSQFAIFIDGALTFSLNESPPTSAKATKLLIELCTLYGFKPSRRNSDSRGPLSPVTAGFLAALALAFYRAVDLEPQFFTSTLSKNLIDKMEIIPIRQYVADLRYYMTLSMHPGSVGSIIWSIFWQPNVQCNTVSPWLSSILNVLRPIIDTGNLDIISKTFALRRPRVALWWLGIFLLGSPAIPGFIVRYLETLEERWGYASMASPDTTVSAWTGSPESFLNEEPSRAYHRYNFCLQDTASTLFSWRPFRVVPKKAIELELWPSLEYCSTRTYKHWIWWIKKGQTVISCNIQLGFRKDNGRFVEEVADCLDTIPLDDARQCSDNINLEPSREATLKMINYCMGDIMGDRDTEALVVPGARTHPWLEGWRGLE
ncbi:hypothetical protein EDB80DRAFT_759635 [Ilyonectria destructans]|nr:hypothetical protein EDB80DRAFT_759635 [Ilyonectria destructans]